MKTFEVGKNYHEVAGYDADVKWTWKCIARTKSSVTMECQDPKPPRDGERTVKLKISKVLTDAVGAETCFFNGRHVLCPVICAGA